MGGVLTDLVTRVKALESKKCQLFPSGVVNVLYQHVLGTEILPGWSLANPVTKTIDIPADGLLNIYAHMESRDMTGKIDLNGTGVNINLNGRWIFACKSTPGSLGGHCEDSNSMTFPVQAGDVLTVAAGTVSANGDRNELMIHLWRY